MSYALPVSVAILLIGALFASERIQLLIVLTTIPIAMVMLPLEYALGTTNQRVKRAFIRRAQLPVLRRDGVDIVPAFVPWDMAYGRRTLSIGGNEGLPLTGLPNRDTGLCIAGDFELVYRSDERGFRNPPQADSGPVDVAILGDSFAHGYCVSDSASIAGRMRRHIPSTVNYGVTGAGPLWELGVLREYAARRRPRLIVWLYFEGNDLESADLERSGYAGRYLDTSFTQRLGDRQPEISAALAARLDSLADSFRPDFSERLRRMLLLREVRARLALNLRVPESSIPVSGVPVDRDLVVLRQALSVASRDAAAWGGRILFVYLPERPRYTDEIRSVHEARRHGHYATRARVIEAAAGAGMLTLDMVPAFDANRDPLLLWGSERVHYNEAGYALVADSIGARAALVLGAPKSSTVAVEAPERWIRVANPTGASIRHSRTAE